MIRKSLREEFEKKMEQDLRRQTLLEIDEEVAVIKSLKNVRKIWQSFCVTGELPEIAQKDYEMIFDSCYSKEDFEPDEDLKIEMVVLSLNSKLYASFMPHDQGGRIRAWYYARVMKNYEKGEARWIGVNDLFQQIKIIKEYKEKLSVIIDRLVERLSDISSYGPSYFLEVETIQCLIDPISVLLKKEAPRYSSILKGAVIDLAKKDTVVLAFFERTNEIIAKVKSMLTELPDPRKISCETVMKRIVEIYESEPEKDRTVVKTTEDALILDHVSLYIPCECRWLLDRCVDFLQYAIVRKSEKGRSYYKASILEAKKVLAEMEKAEKDKK